MQEFFLLTDLINLLTILLRETEKSLQQQRDRSNAVTSEEQPWQRKKQKKLLRKL